jgi:iron complex transport system ATP-binding protein
MVSLKNVSLYYPAETRMVLQDISWIIGRGEAWVLFGRNGSGKTRLLDIATGYLSPSRGSVVRFGCGPAGVDLREQRKKIGLVNSQIRELFPRNERTIDVVVSGMFASTGIYDVVDDHAYGKARQLLAEIGMEDRDKGLFRVLSDGEKQKVLMLRALINDPALLILDEPCMGLDIASREDLLSAVDGLIRTRDVAVIHVTHHVEEITQQFGNIFILDGGRCLYQGPLAGGLNDETMSRVFRKKIVLSSMGGRFHASVNRTDAPDGGNIN